VDGYLKNILSENGDDKCSIIYALRPPFVSPAFKNQFLWLHSQVDNKHSGDGNKVGELNLSSSQSKFWQRIFVMN
jgi:hypothetical protein